MRNMVTAKGKRKKKPPKPDNPKQSRKFIEAAKKMGLEGAGEQFEDALKKLLKPKGGSS